MLKKTPISITNFLNENKFKITDVSTAEKMYLAKHSKKPRVSRKDLSVGDLVVVCEGIYTGKKVVVLKQTEDFKVIVSGVNEFNNVGIFAIDELYLFKLSVNVKIGNIKVPENIFVSTKEDTFESVATVDNSINSTLKTAISSVEYLKGYMGESFKVDDSIDFYSQKY